jgi:hypothetical protein
MGTVIALDLLSTHPEYFSKAVLPWRRTHWSSPLYLKIFTGLTDLLSYETFPSHLPSHISVYWFFQTNWIRKESMIAFSLAKYRPLTAEKAAFVPTLISGQSLVLGTGQK